MTVSSSGVLTSGSNTGTCTITATHNVYSNMTDSVSIDVSYGYVPLTGFTIGCSTTMNGNSTQTCIPLESFTVGCQETMNVSSFQTCGIVATPSNASDRSNTDFTWTSGNASIVAVSSSGVLTSGTTTGTCYYYCYSYKLS